MNRVAYDEETALIVRANQMVREIVYDAPSLALAPYGHIAHRSEIPIAWAAYHEMFREFLQCLANEANAFGHRIAQIQAWGNVLPQFQLTDQVSLRLELVDSISLSALSTPYAFRSRLIFAPAHLSHQANAITDVSWRESRLPSDAGINFKSMKACASRWSAYTELESALSGLSSGAITDSTGDFRNSYHHRLPLHLVHGVSRTVERTRSDSGSWSYGFGGSSPLSLSVLSEALVEQHERALQGFFALSRMVEEQLAAVYAI